ncbi:helix-turn-helix domain-containing protein [Kocuria sp. M1R5S2]|uniref:helix-turn-helix domain-containing protein n=1 Tax=Kocuria rhizosphaerae TaxID=3376285 RepID=UPI0037ABB071
MSQHSPRTTPGLSGRDAELLTEALASRDVTVFVDGTAVRLPGPAQDAVLDLLSRLARGETVTVTSAEELLSTSQAAALAGISHTYMRNLTTQGVIPVQYRGTHRRIRVADVRSWLAGRERSDDDGAPARELS